MRDKRKGALEIALGAGVVLLAAAAFLACPPDLGKPFVDFEAQPTFGSPPLTVSFTNLSEAADEDHAIVAYIWEFGDGDTSTLESPAHTYVNSGAFTVKLNVIYQGGMRSKSKSQFVTVPPTTMALALGTPADEESRGLTLTSRKGFAFAGCRISLPIQQFYDGLCAETNALGQPFWSEVMDWQLHPCNIQINDILPIGAGDFIMTGLHGALPNTDLYIARIDSSGGRVGTDYSGDPLAYDEGFALCRAPTTDNVFAVGLAEDIVRGANGLRMGEYRVNKYENTTVWQDTIQFVDNIRVADVIPLVSGGYLVAGTDAPGGFSTDGLLIWLDGDGSLRKQLRYGDPENDEGFNAVMRTAQGGYIAAGYRNVPGRKREMWLVKVGNNGGLQKQVTFGEAETHEEAYGLLDAGNGQCLLVGRSGSAPGESVDDLATSYGYIVMTSGDDTMQWTRRIDDVAFNMFRSVVSTDDGSFAACGWIQSVPGLYGNGGRDVYLFKFDANGGGGPTPSTVPLKGP